MKIARHPKEFGNYRYTLRVEFTCPGDTPGQGDMAVIMLNPATVREDQDLTVQGPTRRRLANFARNAGYGSMTEVNIFAFRARNREELLQAVRERGIDPVGPENDRVISETVRRADMAVAGWGAVAGNPLLTERAQEVTELLKETGKRLHCIGKNKDGSPRNPARGRYTLQEWP